MTWKAWHSMAVLAVPLMMIVVGLLLPAAHPLLCWLVILVLLFVFTAVIGQGVTGRWQGLLIDERNKISLSRLQMALWTIVVLSAFFTAALFNITSGNSGDPLAIGIPPMLWTLMGISTTSLVGSPLIRNTKTARPANAAEQARTLGVLQQQGNANATAQGQIVVNNAPQDARIADLFQGEETGNAAHLDLGKVQMFFFTLILVLSYAIALGNMFATIAGFIDGFPPLTEGQVALLGISHAGYLLNKAAPHSEG